MSVRIGFRVRYQNLPFEAVQLIEPFFDERLAAGLEQAWSSSFLKYARGTGHVASYRAQRIPQGAEIVLPYRWAINAMEKGSPPFRRISRAGIRRLLWFAERMGFTEPWGFVHSVAVHGTTPPSVPLTQDIPERFENEVSAAVREFNEQA